MSIEIKELDDVIAQWEASILTGIAETINTVSYSEVDRAAVYGLVSVLGLSLMEHGATMRRRKRRIRTRRITHAIKPIFVRTIHRAIKNPR